HPYARERLFEFSPSYATIEARVFFHHSISGISAVKSMRGFTIGAKDGSACANWLADRGIEIRPYPNSELLVKAAGGGDIRLFCMDVPAAQYFLVKEGFADEFRQTSPLYTARFHWATVKGATDLRDFVQRGFDLISSEELREIDARWLGNPLKIPLEARYFRYLAVLAFALVAGTVLLIVWNRTLQTR